MQPKNNHKKKWVYASAIALIIALGIAAKPAYRAFRSHQTDKNLAAARVAASHQDWTTARDKARTVLMVRRDDFEAFRIWALARLKLEEPGAFMAAAQLIINPESERDTRLDAFRSLVRLGPHAIVLAVYYNLPKELTEQPSFRAALVPLLVERREIDLAENGLREVLLPTATPDVKLELLRVLCARTDTPQLPEARRIFAELISTNANNEALEALVLLDAVPGGLAPGDPLPDLQAWLNQQTQASASHHLLAITPDPTNKPAADALYQKTCDRFLKSDPGALGDWLVRHGRPEMAVSTLAEAAKTHPGAYLSRIRALLAMRQIPELEKALASPPPAIDMMELEIMQAKFAALRGEPISADAAWTRAMNHAAFDTTRNRFLEIAKAATAANAKSAVDDAWLAAIRLGWGPLPLYGDLLPVYASLVAKGRTEDLLAMLQVFARFEPNHSDLQNNFCYLSLLHGLMTPRQVIDTITKLVDRDPQPGYFATLMMAEMMDGQAAAALARMPEFRYDPGLSKGLQTALEGTALVLAGNTAAGSAMLKTMDWQDVMPQEQIVLRELLVKLKLAGLAMPELQSPKMVADPEQSPAWRKALDHRLDLADAKLAADPGKTAAWRKAVEQGDKDRASEILPPLPPPKIRGVPPSAAPPASP